MRVCDCVCCVDLPCKDVIHQAYRVRAIEVDPAQVRVVLISEASAPKAEDDYYAPRKGLYERTTVQAFREAGIMVGSLKDILDHGVYLTSAVKCAKTAYSIDLKTIDTCSFLLEKEIDLFPNVCAYLLMGDVAIRAVNTIAKRNGEKRVIPAGSTYKLRGGIYTFRGSRAFPSYLQAGPSFGIEKSKVRMIAEDISMALKY